MSYSNFLCEIKMFKVSSKICHLFVLLNLHLKYVSLVLFGRTLLR